jgi:hypothetical protein
MTIKRLLVPVSALVCLAGLAVTATASARPSVRAFTFSPKSFAVAKGAAAAASGGTTIHFRLSERASVTITLARQLAGRRSHGRCVKSSAKLRKRPACKRYVRAGKMTLKNLAPGEHTVTFSGRVGGRTLAPGTYRATIVAVEKRHHRSKRKRTTFTVKRPSNKGGGGSNPKPAPSPSPTPTPTPTPGGFPNPSTTGVPAGWVPAQTRTSDLVVTQAGAVVQDVLLQNADVIVQAPNVTIRRVKLQGGMINNWQSSSCGNGLTIEDSTIEPPPGQSSAADTEGVVSYGGYTARRVQIWRRAEGFRVGGSPQCGPVRIESSFAKIVIPPGRCDLHSDGIQGYGGGPLAVVNTTIDFNEASCGTAPFFVPKNQGNTSATIDRLLLTGGGAPFRMGVPGSVSGLRIVDKSWEYFPIDVACSLISSWDAQIVTITPDYQVASTVRNQPCDTNGGT